MAASLDSKNHRKFLRRPRLGPLRKEPGKVEVRVLAGIILFIATIGIIGAYFWASYSIQKGEVSIETKTLTCHDDILGIHCGTDGRAWAVGKNGVILHSIDGGRGWKLQVSGTTLPLLAVSFADDRVGFVAGSSGTILSTQDGGLSWEKHSCGIKDSLLGVHAFSETKACAVGAFGTLLFTFDGGTTWRKYKFSWEKLIPHVIEEIGVLVEPQLNAVYFITPEVGWIVGEFGLVLYTRDGGQTWASQRNGGKLGQLFAIAFRDERTGWAVGQRGSFIWTKDGGQHFFPVKHKIDRDLYAVSVEDANILVVGDRVFLASEDGGSTWAEDKAIAENLVLTGVEPAYNSSPLRAIVVGQGGVVLTKDGEKVEKCIFPRY